MCGICGAFQISGDPRPVLEPAVLDRMTDAMIHRGPNDRGQFSQHGVALGARRLSIVDVEGGHQPFSNEDETVWAVQNGELYNHDSIRRGLRRDGHVFRSRCDTEILPHLYEERATRFPNELRGMFGIAVWDARRRRGMLVRDRIGVKPLYYAIAGDLLLFGSELKAILASGLVAPELDHEAIGAYLVFGFMPAPLTPLRGVRKLMPGEMLVVEEGEMRLERYWHYPEPAESLGMTFEDAAAGLLERLEESVRMRLMSDVPLGSMLSGGLDSSLITALMAKNMSEPVKTFSVGFREAGGDNELADARTVASFLGTDHNELELSFSDAHVDLADLSWFIDEPVADLSSLGFLALSGLAAQHVTVALSGQGADELLGGYRKHRAAVICAKWNELPRGVRRAGEAAMGHGTASLRRASRTLAAAAADDRLLAMSSRLDPELMMNLFPGDLGVRGETAARAAVQERLGAATGNPLAVTLHIDGQLALVDDMLHYFDRASMAHSLEVRVPFLDHELVEFCAAIPTSHKIRRLQTKAVLKHAARGLVPKEIVHKRKIGFFNSSVDGWFAAQAEGALKEFLLDGPLASSQVLDEVQVQQLVRRHLDGTSPANPHLLLSILMLEVWLSTYVPRALAGSPVSRERITVPG
jgi:asparagine synthase (glutamine-hydrolysing)